MSKAMKKTISVVLAFITAFAVLMAFLPPVSASAASLINYKITYSAKYAKLTLTPQSASNTIYYTTNGTKPTTASAKYSKTLAAGKEVTIRAVEYNTSGKSVASIKVTLRPRVATPKIMVTSGVGGAKYISASTTTSGAKLYYTTDGSIPTQFSSLYNGKMSYFSGTTVIFRAFKSGMTASEAVAYTDKDEAPAAANNSTSTTTTAKPSTTSTPSSTATTPTNTSKDNTSSSSQTTTASSSSDSFTDTQKRVLELMNKERTAAGAGTLELDETLCKAANARAKELVEKFSHERPDGSRYWALLESMGLVNIASAENIAAGQKTPEEVMNGWMNSSGHRKNILNPTYTHAGIGFYSYGGVNYWVQIFGELR